MNDPLKIAVYEYFDGEKLGTTLCNDVIEAWEAIKASWAFACEDRDMPEMDPVIVYQPTTGGYSVDFNTWKPSPDMPGMPIKFTMTYLVRLVWD